MLDGSRSSRRVIALLATRQAFDRARADGKVGEVAEYGVDAAKHQNSA